MAKANSSTHPNRTHGMSGTPEHWTWKQMVGRCTKPHHSDYGYYGGRGITICDRWRHSFANFYADMGPKPTPKHTIDRTDNDGPYSPENCRWVTRLEQANNQRTNRLIEFDGRTQTLAEWARELGIPARRLWKRLDQGWSVRVSLARPAKNHQLHPPITFDGRTQTLAEWARELGLSCTSLHGRLQRGWSVERTLTTPKLR